MSGPDDHPAIDEFNLIDQLLRPLAHDTAARDLRDDVAVLSAEQGGWVLTHDTLVEGVHFLPTDPLDTVAQKLLRVSLSDIAAKGARPFGYLLSCAWPTSVTVEERARFADGLAREQSLWNISLLGGDTVTTPGPLTLGATMLGQPLGRTVPARSGARPGDRLVVSGVIGDGALGLRAARREDLGLVAEHVASLIAHYRTPTPRLDLASQVAAQARASLDVSDGLIADARHLTGSDLGLDLNLEAMPLSRAASDWLRGQTNRLAALIELATGGDDYQILMAVAADVVGDLGPDWTVIGTFRATPGLEVSIDGQLVRPAREGWRH